MHAAGSQLSFVSQRRPTFTVKRLCSAERFGYLRWHPHRERPIVVLDDFMHREASAPLPYAVIDIAKLGRSPPKQDPA